MLALQVMEDYAIISLDAYAGGRWDRWSGELGKGIENTEMGKVVEVWQKIVGVKTKAATLAFQKAYKLEVDGIAGPEN